jgi:hypothetical protein
MRSDRCTRAERRIAQILRGNPAEIVLLSVLTSFPVPHSNRSPEQ